VCGGRCRFGSALEATQGQIDGFCSQLPYKCHQNRVASVGDSLKIFPRVAPREGGTRGRPPGPLRSCPASPTLLCRPRLHRPRPHPRANEFLEGGASPLLIRESEFALCPFQADGCTDRRAAGKGNVARGPKWWSGAVSLARGMRWRGRIGHATNTKATPFRPPSHQLPGDFCGPKRT